MRRHLAGNLSCEIAASDIPTTPVGEGPSGLLGCLLVTHLSQLALKRADQPADKRRDFFLYLDEFQNFATLSLATMLSELRKYRLNMVLGTSISPSSSWKCGMPFSGTSGLSYRFESVRSTRR
jgi:hypothetical protein